MESDFQRYCRMENKNTFFILPSGALRPRRKDFAAIDWCPGWIFLGFVRLLFRKKGWVSSGITQPWLKWDAITFLCYQLGFQHGKSGTTLLFCLIKYWSQKSAHCRTISVRKPNRRVWLIVIPWFFFFFFPSYIVKSGFPKGKELFASEKSVFHCIKSKSTLSVYPINRFLFLCFWWNKHDLSNQRLLKPITESFHFSKLFQLCNKLCFFLPQSSASCSAQGIMLFQLPTPFKKNYCIRFFLSKSSLKLSGVGNS